MRDVDGKKEHYIVKNVYTTISSLANGSCVIIFTLAGPLKSEPHRSQQCSGEGFKARGMYRT